MKQLEYPYDSDYILRKKKAIRRELLAREGIQYIGKKIAILGGSTTSDIKQILELFLLNYGIKPEFYESEYNRYYEDAVFGNPELDEFMPDMVPVMVLRGDQKLVPNDDLIFEESDILVLVVNTLN